MKRTFSGIDLVRFFAALMVAIYHLGYWCWQPARASEPALLNGLASIAPVVACGWVGVPVFFVISGFVIAFSASEKGAGSFLKGRVARLYPAAWICALVTFAVAPTSLGTLARSLALSPVGPWVSGVYWTLGIEIVFYALVTAALSARWSLSRVALGLGLYSSTFWVAKAVNLALGSPLDFSSIENEHGYLLLAHDGVHFAFGMLLWQRRHSLVAAGFLAIGIIVVGWRSHAIPNAAPFWLAPMVYAGCVFGVVAFAKWNPALPSAARTLGLATYPLYLVHVELGQRVMPALPLSPYASLLIALGVAVLTAFAILPLERLVRRRLLRMLSRFPAIHLSRRSIQPPRLQ